MHVLHPSGCLVSVWFAGKYKTPYSLVSCFFAKNTHHIAWVAWQKNNSQASKVFCIFQQTKRTPSIHWGAKHACIPNVNAHYWMPWICASQQDFVYPSKVIYYIEPPTPTNQSSE
jgi:hypothetical protein